MGLRLLLEALRWALGWLLLCRVAHVTGQVVGGDGPLDLAVIVPARDEEATLPALLASVAGQDRPPAEVVVVDDESADATTAVARAGGAKVVRAPPRPTGWNGKQWACQCGFVATTAAVVCFVDADVTLSRDALARVAAEVQARGGLVSVQPWHRTGSPVEGLSLFPNLVSAMAVDAFGPFGARLSPAGAFGPVLAARRRDHLTAGGHEGVKGAAMEDVALAGSYRRAGLPVTVLAGRGVAELRMYRDGLASVVEGWTKGLGDGARHVRPLTFAAVGLWLSGVASAPLHLVSRPALGALAWSAYALQLAVLGRRLGRFPTWAWLVFPVALAFFVAVFLRSAGAALLGRRVTWKGRRLKA